MASHEGTEEENDFSSIISKIRLQRPDAIYFGSISNQVGVFLRQLREGGVTVPVVGGESLDSRELLKIAGNAAQNLSFTTGAAPAEALRAAKSFAANYQKTFGQAAQGFAVYGYAAAKVVLQGILNAAKANGNKAPSRTQVESAIRKGTFTGLLSGTASFNSVGDRKAVTLYVMKVGGG